MQYSRIAGARFRTFASLVLILFVAPLHTWSTEPPIPADAELSAQGVGTAARTDASEAAVSTNAFVSGTAPTDENFKQASDYSARHGGRALLVMVGGKIVFERYDNGFGPETATHLHSGFSKETDAGASRLIDGDSDRSVVQELPLIISVFAIGTWILGRSVE